MTLRVLLYEHLTHGGLGNLPGSESLAREGLAMLNAVREDLCRCPGVKVITPKEEAFCRENTELNATAALIIAPEFDTLLEKLCQMAIDQGYQLLGSSIEAIRLTADKWQLAQHLERHQIPTIATEVFSETFCPSTPPPWVLKPRDGAGSQGTILVSSSAALPLALQAIREEGCRSELILQPYLAARDGPLSLAFLVGKCQRFPLLLMRQTLSQDGRFHYLGGEVAQDIDATPYVQVATLALDSIPGLLGYVGIDLLWPMGAKSPVVVEINPRITTSYVGLRHLAVDNLMQTLLELVVGENEVAPPLLRKGRLRFTVSGDITE